MIFKWKIAVLGDSSVGKTSLVRHYCEGAFREDYISTIGVSFLRKEISLENNQITLQIWDLGGQNIFSSVRNNYLKGTHGSLILFDLTEKSTLAHVQQWYDEVVGACGKIPTIVIGNKADLPFKDKIIERATAVSEGLKAPFYKTSAKTGENMTEVFQHISKMILDLSTNHINLAGGSENAK